MPSLSIRAQLLIFFCLLAVVPVAILGVLIAQRAESVLSQRVSRELKLETVTAAEHLETYLEGVSRDLFSLARFLQRRLTPRMTEARWREVEDEFFQALHAESTYYQVRFIGADGWEKLRINNLDGRLLRVAPQEYQFKGDRYYVSEALKLSPGEIYLSPLDFNVEHGRIEEPRQLVARMATPVPATAGTVQGIVVINIFGQDLLKMLEPVQPIAGSRLFLIGEGGAYVEQSRGASGLEIQTGDASTLEGPLGIAPDRLLQASNLVEMGGESLLAAARVEAGSSSWLLAKTFPRNLLEQDLAQIRQAIALFALILLLPATALGVLAARRFSRPIDKLATFADVIAGGDYDHRVRHPARDEFGKLADSLNSMAAALEASRRQLLQWNQSLQSEVEHRTGELATSEEKYRLIFSAVSDAILILDTENFRIEDANPAACRLYGYEREELLGQDVFILSDDPERGRQRAAAVLAGRRRIGHAFHRRKDGSLLPVAMAAGVFRWQNRPMVVAIVRDLSEQQRLEKFKNEMLTGISHEMRTPLTAVLGFVELMLENNFSPEETREYLGICRQEGERLSTLIENLLALQRLRTSETLAKQSTDIGALLAEEAAAFAAAQGNDRLQVVCPDDLPRVEADPGLLRQAVSNLLDNARRYSPPGSKIVLGASAEQGGVALWVEDQGPGIAPSVREEIFDRFFRIEFRNKHRMGGTGLGLPLVKEIARLHGGEVRVESRTGAGSTFYIVLPRP